MAFRFGIFAMCIYKLAFREYTIPKREIKKQYTGVVHGVAGLPDHFFAGGILQYLHGADQHNAPEKTFGKAQGQPHIVRYGGIVPCICRKLFPKLLQPALIPGVAEDHEPGRHPDGDRADGRPFPGPLYQSAGGTAPLKYSRHLENRRDLGVKGGIRLIRRMRVAQHRVGPVPGVRYGRQRRIGQITGGAAGDQIMFVFPCISTGWTNGVWRITTESWFRFPESQRIPNESWHSSVPFVP